VNPTIAIDRCGFDRQFNRVQQVARIAACLAQQVVTGFRAEIDLPVTVPEFFILERTVEEDGELVFAQWFELKDARS